MQPDARIVHGLEPGGDLGHGVDHAVRVGGRRTHHQHRVPIDRREELGGGHPPRPGIDLDADEPQAQQVRGLAERRVHRHRRDDRSTVARLSTGDLAGGEAGEHAALGATGRDVPVDVATEPVAALATRARGPSTENVAHTVDYAAVDPGDRGVHRGVEAVDTMGETSRAGRQFVEFGEPGIVDVRQDPAPGGRRVLRPHRGEAGQRVFPAIGDLQGEGIGGHVRSVHRG